MQDDWQKAEKFLKNDGVVVLPTDTLYGIVASVDSKKAIDKIYKIKKRDKTKALIVLISSVEQLKSFSIKGDFSNIFRPKVSVLLFCGIKFIYIHRGTKEIAFRLISSKNKNLHNLIKKVGPIVAPSANRENDKPAETIKEAKDYFENNIDYYINGGVKRGEPSTLIRVKDNKVEILRQGTVKFK